MALAYSTLTENTTPEQRADLDAYIDGRELPSVVRAREQKLAERRKDALTLQQLSKRL